MRDAGTPGLKEMDAATSSRSSVLVLKSDSATSSRSPVPADQ